MNHWFSFFKIAQQSALALLLASLVCTAKAQGQSSQAGSNNPGAAAGGPNISGYGQALNEAKSLARANNFPAAEAAATRFNAFPANTAEWHLETMQKLSHVAHDLAREGGASVVPGLASHVLQHVTQVTARTSDAKIKAQAHARAAVIYEQFIGDPTAAIAAYKTALQLDPDDKGARAGLDRLERADAILRARIQSKTK